MSKKSKDTFYVVSRSRGAVDPKYLNELIKGVNIPAYDIKSFKNIEDARKYYYNGFFDDSDVRIYTLDNNKWYLYQESYTLVKIPFKQIKMNKKLIEPKEKPVIINEKIVCNKRDCEDPYGEGWDCRTCQKR